MARGRWARLRRHAAIPLYGQGYALVLNSVLTAVLGVPYWLLAARNYSASTVGRNAAAISAMMFLAGVAQLNLMSALLRFIPVSGHRSARLVVSSYVVAVALAAGISVAFLLGVDRWAAALAFLSSSPWFALWFAAATMAWCVFNLQDSALTALRSAVLVPAENAATSLAKIGLLVALVGISPHYGIFASWTAALVVSLVPVNVVIFRVLLPRHGRDASERHSPPTRRQLVHYVSADSVASLFWLAATTLMPVIVIAQVGAAANGYFSLAWTIALPLYAISASTGASLVVAAAADERDLPVYARKVILQTACLVVPPAAALAISPGLVLGVFGHAYADHGATTLRLLALSAIPNVLIATYISVLRVRRRMLAVVAVLGALCGMVIALSLVLLGDHGIAGVGLAWLISQLVVVTLLFVLDPRLFWPRSRARSRLTANVGAMRVMRRARRWWPDRRGARRAARLVPEVLASMAVDGTQPPPRGWSLQRCLRTVTDRTVVAVGPPGGEPRAVIKLAATEASARGLAREHEVLAALRADPRLEMWNAMVPTLLADGQVAGYQYAVQGFCPGTVASGLLARPSAAAAFQVAAGSAITVLHAATARSLAVDARVLAQWVDRPILELRRLKPQPAWRAALDRLSAELAGTFAGRTLSVGWIHGDYAPSNILATRDGTRVTGIVDWELATSALLPAVDVTTLLLTTRAEAEERELGHVVRALLTDTTWTDHERALLNQAQPGLAESREEMRAMILLCWLRHAAANLTKSVRYARHRIWIRNNVDSVLDTLRWP
jgi:aminoglycoside phosphotransferase (APT) family kinase protein/O-antigen/teichoic acid export membrane protein